MKVGTGFGSDGGSAMVGYVKAYAEVKTAGMERVAQSSSSWGGGKCNDALAGRA